MAVVTDTGEELTTVAAFLKYARLDKPGDNYVSLLGDVGVDYVDDVLEIKVEDLERFGMTKEMHRKRFVKFASKCRPRDDGGGGGGGGISALREENARLLQQMDELRTQVTELRQAPSTPGHVEPEPVEPMEPLHLFISHSRRDPGALNAARLFAYALKHAVDRVYGKPFCEACYTGPREDPVKAPLVTLWFDKEVMSKLGGAPWAEVLADAQSNALATISFLGNAYLGSNECIKELQFADELLRDGKPLIPFFLESFCNNQQDFVAKRDIWRCDKELREFKQWDKKKQYARKTANCLQGVPAYFDDLAEFTCRDCVGKRDTVCSTCTSWDTVSSGRYRVQAEQAALMLGKYIDHLCFQGVQPEQYDGPTDSRGSPDRRVKHARRFEALQKLHSRSASLEVPGFTSIADEVIDEVARVERTMTTPPRGAFNYDYVSTTSMLSTLDLDALAFPMHPSLTYFLQDMIDEKGTFRDPSGQEFRTVEQCVPLKMVPIGLWIDGSQKTKETLDGSEEMLVMRRRGYGPSAGYSDGMNTGGTAVEQDELHVKPDDLLERQTSGRARATVVLGPAASGKTTMMHRLFVEQAEKAKKCANAADIVAPYIIRVAELAKWLNGPTTEEVVGDHDESILRNFIWHQHGGAGTPLATELTKLLVGNQLTLLFDGLDEAGEQQQRISRFIGTILRSHYNGAIVVTSRESLFVGTDFKTNFDLVQIQPLTKELQKQIVERRFSDTELESKTRFFEESKSLPQEMLDNPLLLTMLIGVFKKEGRLSRTRSELYDQGIRQLIRGRHAENRVAPIVEFLRTLGHLVHVKLKKRDFTESEVMKHLGERSKLLTLYSRAKDQGVEPMELERAMQCDEPEDGVIALMLQSVKGDDEQKLLKELETIDKDNVFDRAFDTGLLMCVDMHNSEDRTFRFTHLTFQEALAAAHCLEELQARLESVEGLFGSMFGTSPDPWLREVLLMTAEQMEAELFTELAIYFLDAEKDDGTGANAVHISCMLTARGEDLQNPSALGKTVLEMLSKLRSTEFMASTLQLPSEQLRRLALREIEEYTMPKAEISTRLLQKLQEGGADAPWYLQTAIVRSLGTLQIASNEVGSALVEICFGRQWHMGVVVEAVRALGNLELENEDCVVSRLLEALDSSVQTEELRATAVKTLIAPLRITEGRVTAKLKELLEQRKLSDDIATAAQAVARPVMIDTGNKNIISSTNQIKMQSPQPEPEPQPEPQPQLSQAQPGPKPGSPSQDDLMDAYDPLVKVRAVIDNLLQDRSVLGGTDSINGGMDIIRNLTRILRCMHEAEKLAQVVMVRDQFEQFMNGATGWWVSPLYAPSRAEEPAESDRGAAAKVVWFFHELSLRLLKGDTQGWSDEAIETKTVKVRDGQRFEVGQRATFHGEDGNFTGRVVSIQPDPTSELPSRCKISAAVESKSDTTATVPKDVELLAYRFLQALEMDFKDNHMRTSKLLFGDADKAGAEMGPLDEFVQPHFQQLVGSSPTRAFSFCAVLHYLRYHSARLLRCDPSGDTNKGLRIGLEDELKRMPQELAVFLRKELRVGSSELDRPYWIEREGTEIEVVARNGLGTDGPSEDMKHEATTQFLDVAQVGIEEAQAFLEHRGWNVEQAIEDYLALKESEALLSEGVPPESAAYSTADSWASVEPTAAETVQRFTACSADQARAALEQTGGDVERAVDFVLNAGSGDYGGGGGGGGRGGGGGSQATGRMSKFTVRFEHPYGSGSAEVSSNARTLEEFNSPLNIKDLKAKFAKEFGCRPHEVSLEVESCDINPGARGLFTDREQRPGLIEYEIEHRVRCRGVWGPWGVAGVQSNARTLEEFSSPRNLRQLKRQLATDTGNDISDVDVRVVGYLDGLAPGSTTSAPDQPGRRAFNREERPGETEEQRARRLGLIDYAVEHRERRNGTWGSWRSAEVASNAPSLEQFQGPGHMRQLTRQYAAEMGVDVRDCEVRVIGYADPAQAKARGLDHLHTPTGRSTGESERSAYGAGSTGSSQYGTPAGTASDDLMPAGSFLSPGSAAYIPRNPNAEPSGSAVTPSPSAARSGVSQVMRDADCSRQDAETALAAANNDVAKAIEALLLRNMYE